MTNDQEEALTMADRLVERRENGGTAMSVGNSGPAAALANESAGVGAALRAAVRPERVGLGRTAKPPDRSQGRFVTANSHYGRYGAG